MKQKPTSIKIGEEADKKSLKARLKKKADKKKISLHAHIVETLEKHGV